jgi:hypothetical protein
LFVAIDKLRGSSIGFESTPIYLAMAINSCDHDESQGMMMDDIWIKNFVRKKDKQSQSIPPTTPNETIRNDSSAVGVSITAATSDSTTQSEASNQRMATSTNNSSAIGSIDSLVLNPNFDNTSMRRPQPKTQKFTCDDVVPALPIDHQHPSIPIPTLPPLPPIDIASAGGDGDGNSQPPLTLKKRKSDYFEDDQNLLEQIEQRSKRKRKHRAKVKLCSAEDCTSRACGGGVCMKHGAKVKLCSAEGCTS